MWLLLLTTLILYLLFDDITYIETAIVIYLFTIKCLLFNFFNNFRYIQELTKLWALKENSSKNLRMFEKKKMIPFC